MTTRRAFLVTAGAFGADLLLGGCGTVPTRPKSIRVLTVGSNYESLPQPWRLHNAIADAETMRACFVSNGNAVVQNLHKELDAHEWRESLLTFLNPLQQDRDFAVFYFAGHAFQRNRITYFLNADGRSCVNTEQILCSLIARARGVLFMIDACRTPEVPNVDPSVPIQVVNLGERPRGAVRADAPLIVDVLPPETWQPIVGREASAGSLVPMEVSLDRRATVFHSTDAYSSASDGQQGRGGPFARVAAQVFRRPIELRDALKIIGDRVHDETGQKPVPYGDIDFPIILAGEIGPVGG